MSFRISWDRCGVRMCWCRSSPRYDRDHMPWTLTSLVEQVVADLGRSRGSDRVDLTLQESVSLRNGLSGRLGQHLRGDMIIGCPWRIGLQILEIVAPRNGGGGYWDDGGPLLAPFA